MSGIWGWFGGSAAQKNKDSPKNAILALRSQLEMLQKREKHLQSQMDEQDGIARKNVNTNKSAAKTALRRKKGYEHTLEQTEGQVATLTQQINAIESANINRETLAAMERASKAMATIHGKLTPEKVDETMEVLREQVALGDEIVAAMNNVHQTNQVDEEDLEAEMEAMQQEQLDEQMLKTGSVPVSDQIQRLPAAADGPIHTGKKATTEDEDEAELQKLQAEMAM